MKKLMAFAALTLPAWLLAMLLRPMFYGPGPAIPTGPVANVMAGQVFTIFVWIIGITVAGVIALMIARWRGK